MPASKNPSVENYVSALSTRPFTREGLELTTTHLIVTAPSRALFRQFLATARVGDSFASILRASSSLLSFASAAGAFVDAGAATLGHAQQLADFKEVRFHGIDETLRLAVLAGRADRDAAVFDDVADTEAFA
jgi:hypothetical protein